MRAVFEASEMKKPEETEERNSEIAAFFDLDGTLLPLPSLERRFFRMLRYRREIPLKSYFLWLGEGLRLLPGGFRTIGHTNKMYLHGVKSLDESGAENFVRFSAHKSGRPLQFRASQAGGQASAPSKRVRCNPRWPVPHFLEEGIERVAWHAKQGHAIVLVSGTLEPLATVSAQLLEAELAALGIKTKIRVSATRLEEVGGRWTGKVLGEAMFGTAKGQAARQFAEELRLDLPNSFAYGNSANDRWLLAAVGKPVAVNPSWRLLRIAKKRNWPVLRWNRERGTSPGHGERREIGVSVQQKLTDDMSPRERSRTFRQPLRSTEPCT